MPPIAATAIPAGLVNNPKAPVKPPKDVVAVVIAVVIPPTPVAPSPATLVNPPMPVVAAPIAVLLAVSVPDSFPILNAALPIVDMPPPVIFKKLPNILAAGPIAAVNKVNFIIACCVSGLASLNFLAKLPIVSINGLAACNPSRNACKNGPPNSIATSTTSFFNIANCDSTVSYRVLASVDNAVFSSHALLDISIAPVNVSDAKANDLSMLD